LKVTLKPFTSARTLAPISPKKFPIAPCRADLEVAQPRKCELRQFNKPGATRANDQIGGKYGRKYRGK
jgi:hypothetical protein